MVFAVAGDAGFFAPTGVEFLATVTFDLKDNDPGVGGSIIGTMVQQITCRNLTTGRVVDVKTRDKSWNCEELGLVVQPGDKIVTTVKGKAK